MSPFTVFTENNLKTVRRGVEVGCQRASAAPEEIPVLRVNSVVLIEHQVEVLPKQVWVFVDFASRREGGGNASRGAGRSGGGKRGSAEEAKKKIAFHQRPTDAGS